MASIALRVPSKLVAAPEAPVETALPLIGAVRTCGWSAVDVDAEQKVEARVRRKLTFKEQLFTWLVDYNRH